MFDGVRKARDQTGIEVLLVGVCHFWEPFVFRPHSVPRSKDVPVVQVFARSFHTCFVFFTVFRFVADDRC